MTLVQRKIRTEHHVLPEEVIKHSQLHESYSTFRLIKYKNIFRELKNSLPNCPAGLRGPGPGSAELRGLLHQRLGGGEPQVPAVQHQPARR